MELTMMGFLLWAAGDEGNSCTLTSLQGYEDAWRLHDGLPLAGEFPEDAFFPMDANFPERIRLSDCLDNLNQSVVVSRRLRDYLIGLDLSGVEYLPVKIVNHKGRISSTEYSVVNPSFSVDCLDVGASGVTYNPIVKTDVMDMDQFVLDESKIDPELRMFRVRNVPGPILVRRDLAEEIDAQGFTAILWMELEDYEG
jgi:hypothetical protein